MPLAAVKSLDELRTFAGRELGVTDWLEVTQDRIDKFAEATGDHQWIHVDPARARAESPYETTIAHGFLTLSLLSHFVRETLALPGLRLAINYGLNRVRFPSPVRCGARIRATVALQSLKDFEGGLEGTYLITIQAEGADKPSCVAEWIARYYR